MTTIPAPARTVTGGVDTHADMHVAAAVDQVGGVLGTASFPTTGAGYRRLLAWLQSHGQLVAVGVEGTGSYGAALVRHCLAPGLLEALIAGEDESHGSTARKYPEELRERATRMAVAARRDPAARSGALRRIGEQLGINPETLRNWVVQAEIDQGHRRGVSTDEAQRIAELEREVRELRRANEILRTASAFFASAERDRSWKRTATASCPVQPSWRPPGTGSRCQRPSTT